MGILDRIKTTIHQATGKNTFQTGGQQYPQQQQFQQGYPPAGAYPQPVGGGYPGVGAQPQQQYGGDQQQQWQQQQYQQQQHPQQQQQQQQPTQGYGTPQSGYGGQAAPTNNMYPPQGQQGNPQHAQKAPPSTAMPSAGAIGSGADFQVMLRSNLQKIIAVNRLEAFYPPQELEIVLARLNNVDFRKLAAQWRMPVELAIDVAALALYDIVIMADDSTSMKYADDGARILDLKMILDRVTEVATLFDHDGLSIRAINSKNAGDGIRSPAEAQHYVANLRFSGMTALGTAIEQRILAQFLVKPLKQRTLKKPVLVITITDGEPTNESDHKIFQVIKDAKKLCAASQYGPNAVAFQFAQVGKDQAAQAFLGKLDNDPVIGKMVDATSYYELEAEEYAKKGVTLTPDLWLVKLMVGAVDPSYDEQDE